MYQECKESSFWPSIALASVKWGTGGFEEACHMQAGVCLNRMGGGLNMCIWQRFRLLVVLLNHSDEHFINSSSSFKIGGTFRRTRGDKCPKAAKATTHSDPKTTLKDNQPPKGDGDYPDATAAAQGQRQRPLSKAVSPAVGSVLVEH